jgi:signal transduction histidine kinase
MCIMSVIIFPVFALFDLQTIPDEEFWKLTFVRWGISLAILIGIVFQKFNYISHIQLSIFAFCSISWFCAWACILGGIQFLFEHNIAYSTVFLAASLFILWHWLYSAFVVASSLLVYLMLAIYYQNFTISQSVMDGGAVLITLMILHPIIAYFRYESSKKACKLKIELEESNVKLKISKEEADSWNVELLKAREELNEANNELKIVNLHLENLVLARTQTLENTNLELQKALGDLDRFLYSSYHDIKGPIARLRGLINVFQHEKNPEKLAEYSDYFLSTVKEMESLIEKLNRVNSLNQKSPKNQQLNVANSLKHFAKLYMNEKIEISTQTPAELSFASDEGILSLILESLLDNCVRYKAANRENRIRLSALQTTFGVEFMIEDNGDGIPANVLPQVFEMFFRGHVRATGHGLGLYLVKKALEKLGGNIKIESQENEFTRVRFYIPNAV